MPSFECPVCKQEFVCDEPYGRDVTCPHCKTQLETGFDESYDVETGEESQWSWIIGVARL